MKFNFTPVEQLLPQFATGLAIQNAGKKSAADGLAACQTALEVGNSIKSFASGDPSTALSSLNAAITNAKMDPAVASVVTQLVQLGLNQAAVNAQVATFVPFLGATAQAALQNIGEGVIAAANLDMPGYEKAAGTSGAPASAAV